MAAFQLGVLPPEQKPSIPEGDDIILYVHGGPGSRLEECSDLVPHLHAAGLAKGKRYTVIAFDQPSQGYSTMVGPNQILPTHDEIGDYYPSVAFSEDFIVAFVEALDKIAPIKQRNIYIIGGSTGGALTLRMGHRTEGWIKRIVAWNPASVWETYAHDGISLDPADMLKGSALHVGFDRSNAGESADDHHNTRKDYFNDAFGKPADLHVAGMSLVNAQPNPEEWYRGNRNDYPGNQPPCSAVWPGKWDYIAAARLEQQEVYHWAYRRWHWRLGTELLLFSFHNDDWLGKARKASGAKPANYLGIRKPTLLAASQDDDWNVGPGLHWENRWSRTQEIANLMRNTPGYTLYLADTGHSIHNERPVLFAQQIVGFLSGSVPAAGPLQIRPLFDKSKMPAESYTPQLPQFPRIPPELLQTSDSAKYLMEPATLGGRYSDSKTAGEYSLRLKQQLRDATKPRTPKSNDPKVRDHRVILPHVVALGTAAARFCQGDVLWGNAFADLAVTGRVSYDMFRSHQPSDAEVTAEARFHLGAAIKPDEKKLANAVQAALARGYIVAWALRHPNPQLGYQLRKSLGWIAVSGEDDPPARPVNVPSGVPIFGPDGKTQVSAYPQYELTVAMHPAVYDKQHNALRAAKPCAPGTSNSVSYQVRYTIASPA